ncbi:MAG TPA: vWA domain-containing protein [Polyangiaceae bacterium]|nr:vWA domain-containing protein [Polyangiaceae bacterium]
MSTLLAFGFVSLSLGVAGCSAGSNPDDTFGAQSGGGGPGSGTGGAGQNGTGGLLLDPGGSTGFGGLAGRDDPDAGTNGNCGVTQKPEEIIQYAPVAIYIMLDRSGSMITGFPEGSAQSWGNSTNAINSFLTDPLSQNMDVGLAFFPTAPDNGFTCGDGSGSGANCGAPVVEIAPVPQNLGPIGNAMSGNQPNPLNLTPTECGLIGMITHCEQWQQQTGEQCVAILVTDGNPTLCSGDTGVLSKIVADGLAQGVKTYVLGLPGSNASVLDPIAQAGGSNSTIDVSGGVQAFVAALNSIRGQVSVGTALPCQWKIPPPPSGQTFDKEKVNVSYTPKGGTSQDFGYVAEADCARATNAWYFDDVNDPKQVLVCPTTCDMLKSNSGAAVSVSFGCRRKPATLK